VQTTCHYKFCADQMKRPAAISGTGPHNAEMPEKKTKALVSNISKSRAAEEVRTQEPKFRATIRAPSAIRSRNLTNGTSDGRWISRPRLTAANRYAWSLGLLSVVTATAVVALYFPYRWFAQLKALRRDGWLSYF
jgi:hypothetical protein